MRTPKDYSYFGDGNELFIEFNDDSQLEFHCGATPMGYWLTHVRLFDRDGNLLLSMENKKNVFFVTAQAEKFDLDGWSRLLKNVLDFLSDQTHYGAVIGRQLILQFDEQLNQPVVPA